MSELEPSAAGPFRALRGDYVEHAGQQIDPQEYLDFFEPLGSSLSRYRDGAGGPFVYRFTASGGRVVGALGWVVSAASRRYGAWKLWGLWTDRPIPAVALPLFWPQLADPSNVAAMVERANRDAQRLFNRKQWSPLCRGLGGMRIHDANFREILKAELSHAYAVPPPYRQPIEIELSPDMLDLLPWVYILGPVDPTEAQLQPSRFNGGGYQYILADGEVPLRDAEIPADVEEIVDAAADDVVSGWKKANELRARRARPAPRPSPPARPLHESPRPQEDHQMTARKAPAAKRPLPLEEWMPIVTVLYRIAVLALLFWIALELRDIRDQKPPPPAAEPVTTTTAASVVPAPAPPPATSSAAEPESPATRIARIARTLSATPPQGIRVSRTAALADSRGLANAAVEVFLRRNGCFNRAEAVDGKISAAEQRAVRTCTALHNERLVNARNEIDEARAIAWLERALSERGR
jgi:hypothetical protein